MNKLFLYSTIVLLSIVSSNVYAQIPGGIDLDQTESQQESGTILTELELEKLLSIACDDSYMSDDPKEVAEDIEDEFDTSLSEEELGELTKTALEINDLPAEEKAATCQM